MRIVRQFFFDYLIGVYSIDETHVIPAEPADRTGRKKTREWDPHRRVEVFEEGRHRDIVEVEFGPFNLRVLGPGEADEAGTYPLGKATVWCGNESVEGPLDVVTWATAAAFIKARKGTENGESTEWGSGGSAARA
jgi:hypothetical protein